MQKYLDLMLDIVQEGGALSLEAIDKLDVTFKKDSSVITQTDTDISNLIHRKLAPLLETENHVLIDEEDPRSIDYLDQQLLNRTKYIWSVDPIDGTRPYSNGIPTYGISIGLLKDCKPWMGVVYFPLLEELFYADGEQAYFVRHAFSKRAVTKKIIPIDEIISNASILFGSETFFRQYKWESDDCRIMLTGAAISHYCWPSIRRGVGSFLRVSLWDMVGSWPIARAAGLEFRDFESGRVIDQLDLNDINCDDKPWKFKTFHILSTERNYHEFKKRIVLRNTIECDLVKDCDN